VRRREFITLLGGAAAAWPLAARAQQPERPRRVGFLRTEKPPAPWMDAFQKALRELGYEEGKNLLFEYRWAGGDDNRLPELASDLVRLNVDVIVVSGTPAILALKKATTTIPTVMAAAGDPVGTGIVKSLAHPGGNITGMSNMIPDVGGKRLQLLTDLAPTAAHIGIIWNANNPFTQLAIHESENAARKLNVRLQSMQVRTAADFDSTFETGSREQIDSLIVVEDPLTIGHRRQIIDFAAKLRIPAVYGAKTFVDAGGFVSFGASFPDLYRRTAFYVDKILKGAKPGELPIEQPTKFELVINRKTASVLGLNIPDKLLALADEVIE
jgi:putative tryptophan/tyrosine transport system substrate-binding protein